MSKQPESAAREIVDNIAYLEDMAAQDKQRAVKQVTAIISKHLRTIEAEIAAEQPAQGWIEPTGDELSLLRAADAVSQEQRCPGCERCARSYATTPGFMYDKCERHRKVPAPVPEEK